ncbi:hypothetical protein CVU75_00750 [Candidatus Dependentiae bacterium HGW-Dependentiae-1]|nr:MAG: hypothetical protein CVU75_00750 [Candidatus Dependentiae bacterium HGW-Dependentiae-1]
MNLLRTFASGFIFVIAFLCAPAHAMWRQAITCPFAGAQQRAGAFVLSIAAAAGVAGYCYAHKAVPSSDLVAPSRLTTIPTTQSVVLWGINNVLFCSPEVPWVLRRFGITAQTFKEVFYKELLCIPEGEIPGVKELPKSAEPPLAVAWLTSRISCQQAKDLVLKHADLFSPSRYIAKSALNPQDLIKRLNSNDALIGVVKQCKSQGNIVGISSSANGEVFDALVAKNQFLITEFDVHFISGKRGMMTSDPQFYDAIIKRFPHKKIYLIDVPGPALVAAKQKGIIPLVFVASKPHAVEDLAATLHAEGLCGKFKK